MAGDFVPFDHDFPEKPETLRICSHTSVTVAQLMLRLHYLWRMFDRQTEDGLLPGLGLDALVLSIGGDVPFWQEVVDAGWLTVTAQGLVMPKFKERFRTSARARMKKYRAAKMEQLAQQERNGSRNGSRNGDVTNAQHGYDPEPEPEPETSTKSLRDGTGRGETEFLVDWNAVAAECQRFNGLGLSKPQDKSLVRKTVVLVLSGRIPRDWMEQGLEEIHPSKARKKPGAFFTKVLANRAADAKKDFRQLLASVKLPAAKEATP